MLDERGDREGRDAVFAQFGRYGGETARTFRANLLNVFESEDGGVVGLHHNTGERNGKRLDVLCCIVSPAGSTSQTSTPGTFTQMMTPNPLAKTLLGERKGGQIFDKTANPMRSAPSRRRSPRLASSQFTNPRRVHPLDRLISQLAFEKALGEPLPDPEQSAQRLARDLPIWLA